MFSLGFKFVKNKKDFDLFKTFIVIFILVNVFKNDSLNYIANFVNYFVILLLLFDNLILKVSEEKLK